MLTILGLTSIAAAVGAIWLAVRIRSIVSVWTACQAWNWMIVALLALLMHAILSLPLLEMSGAVTSAAAYFATTMLLTPLVTLLGARRPGIAAWHWFVVLPMVIVLQWPAVSQLVGTHGRAPIELSAPATLGVVVVLIMSAGTLLGTSSTGVALVYSSGILILLTSATGNKSAQFPVTAFASILILAATWIACQNLNRLLNRLRSATTAAQRTHVVSELFSSLYGLAWTRRVQDRINQFAPREQWTVQLTATGFKRLNGDTPTDDELQRPLEAFIWVLTRFADEGWLRHFLHPENPSDPT
ncbi:MAG: hypothetical protein H7Z17_04230, partial [Fuerstia sp.]|nr:hypothetical protein [Fuerstiella sp.]